jgi:hypothetical protein
LKKIKRIFLTCFQYNDYGSRYKFDFGYFARSVMVWAFSGAITGAGFYGLGKSFVAISRGMVSKSIGDSAKISYIPTNSLYNK